MSENTRDLATRRKAILQSWFEEIMSNDSWRRYVTPEGKLKPALARRRLFEVETGSTDGTWNNNYFKSDHWSQLIRETVFEKWVRKELLNQAPGVSGNKEKECQNSLPASFVDSDLPDEVIRFFQAQSALCRKNEKDMRRLERQLEQKDRKILELLIRRSNIFNSSGIPY